MIPARIPTNEKERLDALWELDILNATPESALDELTQLAALICDAPVSLVTLIDKDRQFFKSRVNLDVIETPREISFCAHAILEQDMLIIEDATKDERFHDNPLVTGPYQVRFYAGVPLTTRDNQNIGTLCTVDMKPRTLDAKQRQALVTLAHQASTQLELIRFLKRLKSKNRDMKAILKNISLGIFALDRTEHFHGEYSDYLTELLGQSNLEGKNILDTIFSKSNISGDGFSQLKAAVGASLEENAIGFSSNVEAFPRELQWGSKDRQKHMELQWDPIINDKDQVEKILVSIKDVTEQKILHERNRVQESEIRIMQELLDIDHERFQSFVQASLRFIDENRRIVSHSKSISADVVRILFINMHTIKGDARTLRLSQITEKAHLAEENYAVLRSGERAHIEPAVLLQDLTQLQDKIEYYQQVATQKLGRTHSPDTLMIPKSDLSKQLEILKNLQKDPMSETQKQLVEKLASDTRNRLFKRADLVVNEFAGQLKRLAKDLSKEEPQAEIERSEFLLTERGVSLFRKVFTHLIRNAVDHGIETAAERLNKGKIASGMIKFRTERVQDSVLKIHFADDGRGLNIKRIRELGENRGLCTPEDSIEKIAHLIFLGDLSTNNVVTDISGRGVGMQAVQQYLQEEGGSIKVALDATEPDAQGFIPFHFELYVPHHLWERAA